MTSIEEYTDITAHLRERHSTIWHTRNIYTLIMLAIVGFTYQLSYEGWALIATVMACSLGATLITVVVAIIEARYARIKNVLMERAIELEDELGFSQYTRVAELKVGHPNTFGRHPRIIYSMLYFGYMTAIFMKLVVGSK